MACVTSPMLGIIWNDEQLDWIKPSRGIRQRDALSPYLSVLCIERLSHIIRCVVEQGKWIGPKASKYGSILTHIFFPNDMILFAEASEDQSKVVKECLDLFCDASGKKVNLSKS